MLRAFEKKDKRARRLAAANLSFLHALEGSGAVAERFARLALGQEEEEHRPQQSMGVRRRRRGGGGQGTAAAMVNLANSLVMQAEEEEEGDHQVPPAAGAAASPRRREALVAAAGLYAEAAAQDGDCLEAGFNLGLVNVWLGRLEEAQAAYERLHARVPQSPEALYQLGHIAELRGQTAAAVCWFELLRAATAAAGGTPSAAGEAGATSLPDAPSPAAAAGAASSPPPVSATDAEVLARLGKLYDQQGDGAQARRCFLASDRADAGQLDVLGWLGGWHAGREEFGAALTYFARAAALAPRDPRWPLLQASCRRRGGDFAGALAAYEGVHARFPEDRECLRCLLQLCRDLGRPCEGYRQALERVERRAGVVLGQGQGESGRRPPPPRQGGLVGGRGVDDGFGDAAVLLP